MKGRPFLSNIVNLIYDVLYINEICIYRYKELVANGTMLYLLITLANKLLLPAFLAIMDHAWNI